VVNGAPRGTAFVIDRDRGLLATAGHTAKSLPLDDPKAEIYILNRATRRPIKVVDKRLHAGFGAFARLVEAYQPVRRNSSIYNPQAAPVRDLPFDAGLITVETFDAVTGSNPLGPNLRIADEEKLLKLDGGDAIAIIGYPYDTLDDGFAADAAIARIERGVIAAMTPPLDAASEASDARIANLIIHRLSTAGGSSGSPVIDAEGEVVGIHTHGIEAISSNADGAAQRGDVLYDLLDPDRERVRLSDLFLPAWSKTLTHWAPAKDALAWSFYMEHGRPGIDPAPFVGDIDFAGPPPFDVQRQDLRFGDPITEHRVAAPDAPGGGGSFLINEPGEFAEASFSVDRSKTTVLYAYDYSLHARSGSCKIASYWRKAGETRLSAQAKRASFELLLEAEGPVRQTYHVVFRRDAGCDPTSKDFFAGAVSWEPEGEVAAASYRQEPLGADFAHVAGLSIEKFWRCTVRQTDDPDLCAEPRYIELDAR
jgi:hypothetical protein